MLLLDHAERRGGSEGVDAFEQWLTAEVNVIDPETADLMDALGVSR